MSSSRKRTTSSKYAKVKTTGSTSPSTQSTQSTPSFAASSAQVTSLTPSQQAFYKGLVGDGRYAVDVTPEQLATKATAHRNANVPLSNAPSSVGISNPLSLCQ